MDDPTANSCDRLALTAISHGFSPMNGVSRGVSRLGLIFCQIPLERLIYCDRFDSAEVASAPGAGNLRFHTCATKSCRPFLQGTCWIKWNFIDLPLCRPPYTRTGFLGTANLPESSHLRPRWLFQRVTRLKQAYSRPSRWILRIISWE